MKQINLKRLTASGCNTTAILLLFAALLFLDGTPYKSLAIAGVAGCMALVGTLLRFQTVFEKWETPHVSFHMKQVGLRGKRQ